MDGKGVVLAFCLMCSGAVAEPLSVTFLDVGEGEAIVVQSGRQAGLIDAVSFSYCPPCKFGSVMIMASRCRNTTIRLDGIGRNTEPGNTGFYKKGIKFNSVTPS